MIFDAPLLSSCFALLMWNWKMLQLGALVKGGHRLSHEITIVSTNIEVSDPTACRKYKGLKPSRIDIDIVLDGRDVVKLIYCFFPKSSSSHP
jgi:hypothetical protein